MKKDVQQIIITRSGEKDDKVVVEINGDKVTVNGKPIDCLLYTSDAADDLLCVDLGGRRIIKKKNIRNT
mgnify:CR=1 FL=1